MMKKVITASPPSNSQNMLGTACRDNLNVNGTPPGLDDWVYFRPPGKCVHVDPHDDTHEMSETIIPLVYVFQIPTPRNGKFLNYSQWQHRLIGVLQIEVMYHSYIVVLPLECLTLLFDMPYMLLLEDIRQGIFYATLFSFWLVFAGEHLMVEDGDQKTSLKGYWRHLLAA
ncbi:hypothetical protein TKK_0001075 [Trichogramma kaykai]